MLSVKYVELEKNGHKLYTYKKKENNCMIFPFKEANYI